MLCYTSSRSTRGELAVLTPRTLLTALFIGLSLTACQRQNEAELTLVAQNISLQTQIAEVRETATVDTERLQITVDYMGTLVGRAEDQHSQLVATQAAQNPPPDNAAAAPTDLPLPNGAVTTAADATATPPPETGAPALVDAVMAPGVGDDDCAVNPTSDFTTDTQEIYIVARGVNIPAGTNIAARFSIAGQEISHDFTPDFDIEDACVWFYIDQTDLAFTAGTWSVQLELNGTPVSSPIPFTIAAMSDQTG